MNSEPELQWRIAGQMPGGGGATPHELNIGRELSGEELDQLNNAIRLLESLSKMDAYARAVQLLQTYSNEFSQVSGRERPPPAALLTPLARSANAVVAALRRVPGAVVSVAGEFVQDGQVLADLREQVRELEQTEPWRLAIALSQSLGDPRRQLVFDEGRLRVRPEQLQALAAAAGAEGDTISSAVGELLTPGLSVALNMTARQLQACQDPIRESSLLVRRIAAEVLLGAPVLLGLPPGEEPTTSLTMTFRALPLAEIQALQLALSRAPSLLEASTASVAQPSAARPKGAAGVEDGAEGRDIDEEEERQSPQQGEEAPGDAERAGGGTSPELGPPPPPAEPQPLDFDALINHLSRLPAETERAWSKALQADLLTQSEEVLRAQWSSLLAVIYREANDSTERMRARGIDPVMAGHPEDPAVLQHLNHDGEPLDLWRALSVAQMRALIGVAKCLEGLTKPKAPFGHGGPDELTWWEAGAFALIRLRAAELGRVTAQLLDAERMLDGSPMRQPEGALSLTGPWRVRLTLADEAVLRGDPEAAVLHLRLVLRERAGQLAGMALDDVPEDLEDRLASDPELADMAQGLRLLAHVGRRMEQRRPESLGYVLPVAELMLKPLTRLCLSLSGALIRATRDEDQDGPAEEEQGGADSAR